VRPCDSVGMPVVVGHPETPSEVERGLVAEKGVGPGRESREAYSLQHEQAAFRGRERGVNIV